MNAKSIATTIFELSQAIENCEKNNNHEWKLKHKQRLDALAKMLPSGSGIDSGTTIRMVRTSQGDEMIMLRCGFHHMNDSGMYDGWTEHTITVYPSFSGLRIVISGKDRNDIKEYLHDVYSHALKQFVIMDSQERWHGPFDDAPKTVELPGAETKYVSPSEEKSEC